MSGSRRFEFGFAMLVGWGLLASSAAAQGTNIAPLGTASQSTTGFGGDASRGNDGNTDGNYGGNSVTHTNTDDPAPSWQVELDADYTLLRVVVWNRTDCCGERLHDFRVSVLDASSAVVNSQVVVDPPAPSSVVALPAGTQGRIVKVEFDDPASHPADGRFISLAEVEVFADIALPPTISSQPSSAVVSIGGRFAASAAVVGADSLQWTHDGMDIQGATQATLVIQPVTAADAGSYRLIARNANGETRSRAANLVIGPRNFALGGTATQSTTGFGGDAVRGNDGNTDGNYGGNSVTHTNTGDPDPTWEVDLGSEIEIGRVVVYGRTDCCIERLNNFQVEVIDSAGAVVAAAMQGPAPAIKAELLFPPGTFGNRVRVSFVEPGAMDPAQLFLSLAEVEVYGPAQFSALPAAGEIGLALLMAALVLGGAVILRRRLAAETRLAGSAAGR